MKKLIAIAMAALMVLSLAACGETPASTTPGTEAPKTTAAPAQTTAAPEKTEAAGYKYNGPRLTLGSADSTGTMYAAGAAIATAFTNKIDGLQVENTSSSGSNQNALDVNEGEIELGMCAGDAGYAATHGTGKFADKGIQENIRGLGCVYSSLVSLVALKSSGATYVHDLANMKGVIGVGPAASSTEVATLAGLEAAGVVKGNGLDFTNMTLGDAANAVKDGTALAGGAFAGVPVGGQLSAGSEKECVWLGFTDEEIAAVIAKNPAYTKLSIPAGTYTAGVTTQAEAIPTFGVKCMVICNKDMDEELAYQLAKVLWEQAVDLASGNKFFAEMVANGAASDYICTDCPVQLHPGAEKFYKEIGALK